MHIDKMGIMITTYATYIPNSDEVGQTMNSASFERVCIFLNFDAAKQIYLNQSDESCGIFYLSILLHPPKTYPHPLNFARIRPKKSFPQSFWACSICNNVTRKMSKTI